MESIRIHGVTNLTLNIHGGAPTTGKASFSIEEICRAFNVPPAAVAPRFTFIGEGCFRDALQPGWEFTPTLNSESKSQPECERIARECTLLGGGWELPDDPMLLARLVSYDHHAPATFPELKADTRSDWYWTRKRTAWSSGRVWFVGFGGGYVYGLGPGDGGFARGVRRVPVLAGQ